MMTNVVPIHKDILFKQKEESVLIHDQIKRYFDKLERKSIKTRISYEADIRMFFRFRGKELEELTEEDMQLKLDDFEDFIGHFKKLKNKKRERVYTNKTINRKTAAVKGLILYLSSKEIINNISYLHYVELLPETTEHYDAMTVDEVIEMSRLASLERDKGEIKRLLLLFALDTGIRKGAILNLKWTNFKVDSEEVIIKGIDKGNQQYTKKISKEFYEDLLKIKETDHVFNIKEITVTKMFERLRGKMDFGDRNIVFHSIRKASGTFVYNQTKDLNATRIHLNHASPNTTVIYTQANDYGAVGAISIRSQINTELYKKATHEQLVEAISKLDSGTQILLNKELANMVNKDDN